MTGDAGRTVDTASEIQALLAREGVPSVLIGALAMAHHHYPRATEDLDLAVSVEPARMRLLAQLFEQRGFEIRLGEPDPQDPLGGVLTLSQEGVLDIQIVNFNNAPAGGIPALVESAIASAGRTGGERSLVVVDLPHLVAFKLYAGGPKSEADLRELLKRNPEADPRAIRAVAQRFRLERGLKALLP